MKMPYLVQIDLLKGLAIISVIILHTLPAFMLILLFTNLCIWQAVPIFIILMSLTSGMSFTRRGYMTLKGFAFKSYLRGRFERIIYPFFFLFAFLVAVGALIFVITGRNILYIGALNIVGVLPVSGPGNYFITLVFQFIFVFPLIYFGYKKAPKLTIVMCFVVNLAFELSALFVFASGAEYLYKANILRYLSAIALGLWISDDFDLFSTRNRFILLGAPVSIAYLLLSDIVAFPNAAGTYTTINPWFLPEWYTQNMVSFFYPTLLVLIGIRYLPVTTKNPAASMLAHCGKLSYHIFLFQIVYFAFYFILLQNTPVINASDKYPYMAISLALLGNIILCVIGGSLFYKIENRSKKYLKC
jgi:peptidoglycan/LPS O-acetylase OafA/YrhL